MRRTILLLFTSTFFLLASCSSSSKTLAPATPQLVFMRTEAYTSLQVVAQADLNSPFSPIPVSLLADCTVYHLYPNPVDSSLAIEFDCGGQPVVELADTRSASASPASSRYADARFLAWSASGRYLYLKSNPLDAPHVIRVDRLSTAAPKKLSLPTTVYDLAGLPDGRIVYSTTQGLGFGSETWLADASGGHAEKILAEPLNIVAYLRPSPDSSQIAYIRMPDSQVPFTVGGLWVIPANGGEARFLAEADAGHGYAPAWSPGGRQIASCHLLQRCHCRSARLVAGWEWPVFYRT